MEGANLLRKNMLDIPKEVIVVFADVGMSQLFGDDFFEVKRDPSLKYGVYYHAGYYHTGPHLGEGVIPEKMEYSYHLAREKSSLYYSIINACNVKEHLFGLYLNSRLAFDHDYTAKRAINEYTSLYIKCPENKFLIDSLTSFYNSLKDIGDDYYKDFCNKYNFSYHKYENLPFPIVNANDGLFKAFIYNFYYEQREPVRKPIIKKICDEGYIFMNDTLNKFNEVANFIPNNYLEGFKSHWIYQCKYYIHLFKSMSIFYDACEEASKKNFDTCKNLFKLSSDELINILDDRKIYFKNDYSTWLDNDHKIDIPFLIRRILEDYDRVLQVNGLA